jgi:RNA polymerase sigma-70 factor (ECF subfamily)
VEKERQHDPEERMKDEDLARAYATRGDRGAYAELVRRHGPFVFRVAFRVLRADDLAHDVAQETFLGFLDSPDSWKPTGSFQAWLGRVARNAALNAARSRKRRDRRERAAALARGEEQPMEGAKPEELARVRECVLDLPEELRTPLTLKFFDKLPNRSIAEILACSTGTVSNRIQAGLGRLRERLAGAGLAALAPGIEGILDAAPPESVPPTLLPSLEDLWPRTAPPPGPVAKGGIPVKTMTIVTAVTGAVALTVLFLVFAARPGKNPAVIHEVAGNVVKKKSEPKGNPVETGEVERPAGNEVGGDEGRERVQAPPAKPPADTPVKGEVGDAATARLFGRVVEEGSEQPVASPFRLLVFENQQIRLAEFRNRTEAFLWMVETDFATPLKGIDCRSDTGEFSVPGFAEGEYFVIAVAQGFVPQRRAFSAVVDGGKALVFKLFREEPVDVTVRDGETEALLENVTLVPIVSFNDPDFVVPLRDYEVKSDPSGTATIRGLMGKRLHLLAEGGGYPRSLHWLSREPLTVNDREGSRCRESRDRPQGVREGGSRSRGVSSRREGEFRFAFPAPSGHVPGAGDFRHRGCQRRAPEVRGPSGKECDRGPWRLGREGGMHSSRDGQGRAGKAHEGGIHHDPHSRAAGIVPYRRRRGDV